MAFQIGIDREQALLFPVSPDEMIPEEHPVRIIDLFIENLDLKKLGVIDSESAVEGRPAYDPKDLLKFLCIPTSKRCFMEFKKRLLKLFYFVYSQWRFPIVNRAQLQF